MGSVNYKVPLHCYVLLFCAVYPLQGAMVLKNSQLKKLVTSNLSRVHTLGELIASNDGFIGCYCPV